jgi:hypothetical protein
VYEANEAKVLSLIGPEDVVLDVGGWARCFNRANYVLDAAAYETRGTCYREAFQLEAQGGPVEHFTDETWIRLDLCDRTPWPFEDKAIDFCMCSHTLEDIRDPLWVCSEIRRVAKRGYIEVPSRAFEASRNREPGVPVGLCHHRWHCEIEGAHITFFPKMHHIHGDPRCSIPESCWQSLPEEELVAWLFWEDHFTFEEKYLSPDDHRAFAARYAEPSDEATGTDVAQLRGELEAIRAELAAIHDRFGPLEELGPLSIEVARRLANLSRRHSRLSSAVKRLVRAAS